MSRILIAVSIYCVIDVAANADDLTIIDEEFDRAPAFTMSAPEFSTVAPSIIGGSPADPAAWPATLTFAGPELDCTATVIGEKCWFPRGTEPVFPPRSEPPLSMVF